jgi:hypothetical protein
LIITKESYKKEPFFLSNYVLEKETIFRKENYGGSDVKFERWVRQHICKKSPILIYIKISASNTPQKRLCVFSSLTLIFFFNVFLTSSSNMNHEVMMMKHMTNFLFRNNFLQFIFKFVVTLTTYIFHKEKKRNTTPYQYHPPYSNTNQLYGCSRIVELSIII